MATRLKFEKTSDIGCYALLTNTYCLVADGAPESFLNTIADEVFPLPVIETSCGNTSLIGRMFIGNSHGLVVPGMTTETELAHLRSELPHEVTVTQVNENLSALGNHCACNDHVALCNPELSDETVNEIQSTLQVKVAKMKINGEHSLVGSYCRLTNKGALVHPFTSVACIA